MNRKIVLGIVLGLGLAIAGLYQKNAAAQLGNMALRLVPEDVQQGVPQAFTFQLVNTSGHDLRVPMPAIQCDDSYFGDLRLQLNFVPLKPGKNESGNGCSLGHGGMQDILEHANQWKLLHAGESLSLKAGKKKLFYATKLPGSYEFWAEYTPIELSASEQQQLREAGIDYPHEKLASDRTTFQKKL